MKKVYAINGSPRKKWNTAILLEHALKGAETELIHLYDLDFKGCRSCFACKHAVRQKNSNCIHLHHEPAGTTGEGTSLSGTLWNQ